MAETRTALARRAPPALVLWSDHDRVFPVEAGRRFAATIPGPAFRVIEGAGHFLQEEQGEQSGREIARFITAP